MSDQLSGATATSTGTPLPAGRGWRATRTALHLGPSLSFGDWQQLGRRVGAVADSSAWWIGDWLLFGERSYGRRYRGAIEATGLDYQTLRNYAWVASRFSVSRRRDDLTFGHHAEQTPGRAGWTLTVGGIAAGRYAEPFLPSQAAFSLLGYRTAVADRPRSSACPQIMCILAAAALGAGALAHVPAKFH